MFNHQAGVKPVYWLMLANCCFSYGRCCCHSFCGRCFCHCFAFLADVIAIFLLADVIAIVFGWWQMLLPLWLLFLPLVGMLYIMWQMLLPSLLADVIAIFVAVFVTDVMATMADGIAINETDVIGRCYLPGWQME